MLGSDKIVVFSDDENCCQYFAKHYTTCPISKSDKGNESFFHRTLELVRYLSLYNIQQIFYANYMASAIFYDALLIKASGIKLIIINFEYMFSNMTQLRKGGAFLLQAIKLADNLLTFYPGEMDFWKQQGTNCSLISFPEKTEKNVSTTEHHIVWMGECKNIPYNFYDVVEIMERLSKKISNVKIDMICIEADPEKIHNFETRANDFGISDKIALHYDLDEIDHIYQKAEICLMTSEYEIFPAALLKAYEYHLPIISYEQPCIYEFDDKLPIISIPKRDFFMASEILSEYLENNSWENNITHKKRFSLTEVIFLHYKYGVMKYKRQVSKNKKLEAELENIKTEYIKLKNLYNKVVEKQNIPAIQEDSKKKIPFFRRK